MSGRIGTGAPSAPGALTVLLGSEDLRADLCRDARLGLSATPKWLPPKYFYDARGSELFEQITALPEYYPTRAERALLERHAGEIAQRSGAQVLQELGSGSSVKTRILLDALDDAGTLTGYVPVDVSRAALEGARDWLAATRPGLAVHAVLADLEQDLYRLPVPGRRMLAFLGGTIGNFPPERRRHFLAAVAAALHPQESFLVGIDLVKDAGRLVAAYDDAQGVTAEFNRNVLSVLNRELGADFPVEEFTHVARWNGRGEWIEMRLRAPRALVVTVAALGLDVRFAAGEEMLTEISAKFRPERFPLELAAVGLQVRGWWTDGDFALVLAGR